MLHRQVLWPSNYEIVENKRIHTLGLTHTLSYTVLWVIASSDTSFLLNKNSFKLIHLYGLKFDLSSTMKKQKTEACNTKSLRFDFY